jgi:hypothetical protein
MSVYAKLREIQLNLIAPKNQYNSFGKYNYRSCEDILEGLKPCLQATQTAVTVNDEIVQIGDRYYVKATATLFDCETCEYVSNTAYAREEESKKGMDASQVTGATSSYARKYALNGLFCIDDVKDADSRDNRQEEAKQQKKEEQQQKEIENSVISEVKAKALLARCETEGVNPETICKLYKVKSLEELTEKKYANINLHWKEIKEQ